MTSIKTDTTTASRIRYTRSSDKEQRPKRRKRTAEEAREEALIAARALLLEGGPGAVTVLNVSKQIGMSHANVLHHFGTAADLQTALMGSMVADLATALDDTVAQIRSNATASREVVDRVFDAFSSGGAGQLAAWIMLSRDAEHLEPIRDAVQALVAAFCEKLNGEDIEDKVKGAVLTVAICAFGDAVIGPPLRDMLHQSDDKMRNLTAHLLTKMGIDTPA